MRIISLLHRNFELFSEILEFNSRVNINLEKSKNMLSDDWIGQKVHNWINSLKDKVESLSLNDMQKLSINDNQLMNMRAALKNYDIAKDNMQAAFNKFLFNYPQFKQRYIYDFDKQNEELVPNVETISLQTQIALNKEPYLISIMIAFDNPVANASLKSIKDFDLRTELCFRMIESGAFFTYMDISKNLNGKLVPIISSNHTSTMKSIHNDILIKLTDIIENDYDILNHFIKTNDCLLDFSEKSQIIPTILQECSNDNLHRVATNESVLLLKYIIEEQKINELLVSPSVFTQRLFNKM